MSNINISRPLLAAVILGSISSDLFAWPFRFGAESTYFPISESAHSIFFVSPETLKISDDHFSVKMREKVQPQSIYMSGYARSDAEFHFDCVLHRVRVINPSFYDYYGDTVYHHESPFFASWNTPEQGSLGEKLVKDVCMKFDHAVLR